MYMPSKKIVTLIIDITSLLFKIIYKSVNLSLIASYHNLDPEIFESHYINSD